MHVEGAETRDVQNVLFDHVPVVERKYQLGVPGFDAAYPLPALIANNYGDMMSIPLYDAALMGAALVLLIVILIFNIISTLVLQRMLGRKQA